MDYLLADRLEAMGSTIVLHGFSKKVYIRSDVNKWEVFKSHDIAVYGIKKFGIEVFDEKVLSKKQAYLKGFMSARC